jgi:DNA phosphorothioation-dependent restriction protein DptG
MKKLSARWVSRLLTADQKHTRIKISEQCLKRFNKNKTDFVCQFITLDETWIHHYTSESKQQSKQWTEASCSALKKTRSVPSVGRIVNNSVALIDNIFIDNRRSYTIKLCSNGLSDHDGQILSLPNLFIPSNSVTYIHTRRFDNNTIADFQLQLSCEQWDDVFGNNNVN